MTRKYTALLGAWALALLLTLSYQPAFAAHTITQGANFAVEVTADESVTIDASGSNIRVVITGPGVNVTQSGPTQAANVTSITVTATGNFPNTINLSGVTPGQFSSLTSVTVNSGGGGDTITGSGIGDTLNGEGGSDTINGGSGNDTITGGNGNDNLSGDAGNDTYVFDADGAQGSDTVNETSGNGTDTLDFSATTTQGVTVALNDNLLQVVNANLSLTLSNNIENVTGGDGDDTLTGNNLNNVLRGNGGNDTLISRGLADILVGNSGTDEAIVTGTGAAENFSVGANGANITVNELTSLGTFEVRSSETLTINAQAGADTFTVGDLTGVSNLDTINLNGLGDDDTFNIAPSTVATIYVAGGTHITGDTLNFDLTGVTSPQLIDSGAVGIRLTSGNRQDVYYTGIEVVTPSPEVQGLVVNTDSGDINSFDGFTSLSEAIIFANSISSPGDDTITFDIAGAGPHTIQLTEQLPSVRSNINFSGSTDESVTIRGGGTGAFDILNIQGGETAIISNLTLTNANSAITNDGTLTLTSSTLSGNNNGLINLGSATLTNSTISGNSAGVISFDVDMLNATNVTITNNLVGITSNGTANVQNSIVAGNTTNVNGSNPINDVGNNVLSGDPELGPLQNNGGPTFTHALLYGSPAINAGNDAAAPTTDQRGLPRPVGSASDIGAFEAQALYSISGYIRTRDLAPISGVSVQLNSASGPSGSPVTTDASGFYSFQDVPAGGYLVTPTKAGFTFIPTAQSLVVSNAPRAANFIGTRTASAYRIIGRVTNTSGQPVQGVTVTLSPAPDGTVSTVTTNSAGYYTFNNVPAGSYTVTPSFGSNIFTPASRNVTVVDADVTGQNFVASTGYSVFGRIATSSGIAIPGVTVQLDNGQTATTNSAGYYTFNNVPNGTHIITPSKAGYTFTPPQRTVEVNNANIGAQNFTGTTS